MPSSLLHQLTSSSLPLLPRPTRVLGRNLPLRIYDLLQRLIALVFSFSASVNTLR